MAEQDAAAPRPLHKIADEIGRLWREPYFGAAPYIYGMRHLDRITDKFGGDDGVDVVMYFLDNARTWRGEDAKRIKAELKAMLPERYR